MEEKFDSSPYSETSSVSKMAVSIGGCHLQLKEQFSLGESLAILEEPFGSFLKLETLPKADPERSPVVKNFFFSRVNKYISVGESN